MDHPSQDDHGGRLNRARRQPVPHRLYARSGGHLVSQGARIVPILAARCVCLSGLMGATCEGLGICSWCQHGRGACYYAG